jgi:hypothetical protein
VPKKVKLKQRVKLYPILSEAVERGTAYGYHRAHKHVESPSEEEITQAISNAVMAELCEVIDFED